MQMTTAEITSPQYPLQADFTPISSGCGGGGGGGAKVLAVRPISHRFYMLIVRVAELARARASAIIMGLGRKQQRERAQARAKWCAVSLFISSTILYVLARAVRAVMMMLQLYSACFFLYFVNVFDRIPAQLAGLIFDMICSRFSGASVRVPHRESWLRHLFARIGALTHYYNRTAENKTTEIHEKPIWALRGGCGCGC